MCLELLMQITEVLHSLLALDPESLFNSGPSFVDLIEFILVDFPLVLESLHIRFLYYKFYIKDESVSRVFP